jgi:hypothetical protein
VYRALEAGTRIRLETHFGKPWDLRQVAEPIKPPTSRVAAGRQPGTSKHNKLRVIVDACTLAQPDSVFLANSERHAKADVYSAGRLLFFILYIFICLFASLSL